MGEEQLVKGAFPTDWRFPLTAIWGLKIYNLQRKCTKLACLDLETLSIL